MDMYERFSGDFKNESELEEEFEEAGLDFYEEEQTHFAKLFDN
jgi:hypothetical protein